MIEPDERGRVSLSKIPGNNADRYIARRLPNGSIILQPAVLIPTQALDSLVALQATRRNGKREGRALGDVLDRHNRSAPSDTRLAEAEADLAQRRDEGARFLSDLTDAERQSLQDAVDAAD